VFTLPAIGWLVGSVVEHGRRESGVLAGALAMGLLTGGPVERIFGVDIPQTNHTEEQVVTRRAIAPLVVQQLDTEEGPPTILMTEQSYNLLVPLYADRRQDARSAPDSSVLAFTYGARTIVVAHRWDWDDLQQLRGTLVDAAKVPGLDVDADRAVLAIAGGWGSGLFPHIPRLQQSGAVLDVVVVTGPDALGDPIVRVMGVVLDRAAVEGG